jgi:tetratricopeptide (TPR) repeat protein
MQDLVRVAGDGGTAVVCALAGQRGVGKTQVAAAYARLRIQHGWPVIVWAEADTEAGTVAALDELAAAAGMRQPGADPQDAARAGLRWLRAHPGPCLLVYDNAVDADLIRTWTPPVGSVHTVVTTTRRELDGLGDLIDVTLFSPAEAVAYLQRRTTLQDSDATSLAEQLGRLPLALAQAAAIIGPGRRYPTYRRYLKALDRTPTAALLPHTPGDPYPYGLAEAVLLSLDDLRHADPHGRSRQLLDCLAVLAPTGAGPELVQHLIRGDRPDLELDGLDADEGIDLDRVVAVLVGRSLTIPANGDANRTVVHRLVQRVVRERCQHTGTLDAVITATITAVDAAARQASETWHQRALLIEYTQHAQTLLTHIVDDVNRGTVLALLGRLLRWLNDAHSYTTSIAIGATVVGESERVLGPDHTDTLRSRNSVAFAYAAVGRLDEAIGLFTRAVADFERVLGPDHTDTLISLNNLAASYQAAGRLDEAIGLHARTLANRERVLGPDDPDTLSSRNNLARAYQVMGRLDEALALFTRTVVDFERVLGPNHPGTLNSRNNLAGAYEALGRLDEAVELHARTLADRERVLGPNHPDTLNSRNNLAHAYQVVGRLDEAVDLYTRTLAECERVLGPDHPATLISRNNLACAYRAANRTDKAEALPDDH